MNQCNTLAADTRRTFWATQPDACGSQPTCDDGTCGKPGLSLTSSSCGRLRCRCCPPITQNPACPPSNAELPRRIVTDNWLRGLVLNILMTDGRKPDTTCGYAPNAIGGHWTDSFRDDGQRVGTLVRYLPANTSMNRIALAVEARLKADLAKLVITGVAVAVDVDAVYIGGRRIQADVTVTTAASQVARVGVIGSQVNNSWAWS